MWSLPPPQEVGIKPIPSGSEFPTNVGSCLVILFPKRLTIDSVRKKTALKIGPDFGFLLPDFTSVRFFPLKVHTQYAHLKKHEYLAPTSVSRPSVNRFGSYLVMLQPHIPSSSPGVRKVKIDLLDSLRRCAPQWPEKKLARFYECPVFSAQSTHPLKKHEYLAPTSVSRPSVNRFGSYLVMLQPHIPSSSPGVRKVKIDLLDRLRRCAPQWPEKFEKKSKK